MTLVKVETNPTASLKPISMALVRVEDKPTREAMSGEVSISLLRIELNPNCVVIVTSTSAPPKSPKLALGQNIL